MSSIDRERLWPIVRSSNRVIVRDVVKSPTLWSIVLLATALSLLATAFGCSRRDVSNRDSPAIEKSSSDELISTPEIQELLANPPPVQWFGVSLSGKKIGHVSLELRVEPAAISVITKLRVAAADGQSILALEERRLFEREPPFALIEVSSVERSPDEERAIEIAIRGGAMERRITVDGKLSSSGGVPRSAETLVDTVIHSFARPEWLELGDATRIHELDLDTGRDRASEVSVANKRAIAIAGVHSRIVELAIERPGEIATRQVLGSDGLLLAAEIGAFGFTAQDERSAKGDVVGLDLAAANIKTQKAIGDVQYITALELRVRRNDDEPIRASHIPARANQQVAWERGPQSSLVLTLTRAASGPVSAAERGPALSPTPSLDFEAPSVRALANELAPEGTPRKAAVKRINNWVYSTLEKRLSTDLSTASAVLEKRVGDCTEHSLLFVALARAAKIPAREVSGLIYLGDEARAFGWHAWAEVEIGGQWWAVDPSWNEIPANATHITLGIGDDSRWIALIGALEIEILAAHES